jgi:hypothetical protein
VLGPAAPVVSTSFSGTDRFNALGVVFDFTEGPRCNGGISGYSTPPATI